PEEHTRGADVVWRRRTAARPVLRRPQPGNRLERQLVRDRDLQRRADPAVSFQGRKAGHKQGARCAMAAKAIIGIVAATAIVAAVAAQTRINPTDPQPTCNMCPGSYIPLSELQAYTKKAVDEKLLDQQVRDIEIGKAHVGIGMVHRVKID